MECECLTVSAGRACSSKIVGTLDLIHNVNIYKVPMKKMPIRLVLEVVTDTSEINAPHIPRDDTAIMEAFDANNLTVSKAYTDPFRVLVTVRQN